MRHDSCWESKNKRLYSDIAAWCNQPGIFKNMTFDEFLKKRHQKEYMKKVERRT